jgi:hypothetical protein
MTNTKGENMTDGGNCYVCGQPLPDERLILLLVGEGMDVGVGACHVGCGEALRWMPGIQGLEPFGIEVDVTADAVPQFDRFEHRLRPGRLLVLGLPANMPAWCRQRRPDRVF